MKRQGYTNKVMVLGIDGMDPSVTSKYLAKGLLPNIKKFLERGAAADNLAMLGGHPTITPPMWTTLATGAYPVTHGIVDFWLPYKNTLDKTCYGLDSRTCKAEQMWNVTAENGLKTLVWHWPGSAWPPSSDSENLHVVDGTQPEGVGSGTGVVEKEFVLVADVKVAEATYRQQAAIGVVPCAIDELEAEKFDNINHIQAALAVGIDANQLIILEAKEGQGLLGRNPFDVVLSPIKPAVGWVEAPEDALEFTMLLSAGTIRRVGLILKNAEGIYDTVALYKNKKNAEPLAILPKGQYVSRVADEAIKKEVRYEVERSMRVIDLAEDGSHLRMWIGAAMNIHDDSVWYPQRLHKMVYDNVGPATHGASLGGLDESLMKCMVEDWGYHGEWCAKAINCLIDVEGYDVVFSHMHSLDCIGHNMIKFMDRKDSDLLPTEVYEGILEFAYTKADEYIGKYLHLLDKGWSIMIVSDHGQACPEHKPMLIGEPMGVSVGLMRELGYTEVLKDENGNDLHEIDWSKTRAVARGSNFIFLNIKGRNPEGIVEPEDQYELEEQIITDLYGYRHPESGKRTIALALRKKDALVLGYGGDMCGDIVFITAEGYHFDHGDCLTTTCGFGGTCVAPIFMAAGSGFKEGFTTERIIREVDVAPTVAALLGLRMPAQCEGAPVYQIFNEEF